MIERVLTYVCSSENCPTREEKLSVSERRKLGMEKSEFTWTSITRLGETYHLCSLECIVEWTNEEESRDIAKAIILAEKEAAEAAEAAAQEEEVERLRLARLEAEELAALELARLEAEELAALEPE